jgi:dCTP deaminase
MIEQKKENINLPPQLKQSLLSDKAILQHIQRGSIVIEPFHDQNLCTSSYDVTLGKYYFRESSPEPGMAVYNPYSKTQVERIWGKPLKAERAGEWTKRTGTKLENIKSSDQIIWISPGETILGHTIEWIGGKDTVTTMMKARSSMGRNFIEVCKCAGWGDVGYINRWTMEITNNSRYYSIPLVVGRRIAQIIFFNTDGTIEKKDYTINGKYQSTMNLEQLKSQWNPLSCLPKMYQDREINYVVPLSNKRKKIKRKNRKNKKRMKE